MNEIINKFSLGRDKFMPEMHLKQPGYTYSACGPFTKIKERIEKFMRTRNTDYIYKNDLDKAFFQHEIVYNKCKVLPKRTELHKVFRDKAFKISTTPNHDGYQRGALMIYKIFDKNSAGSGVATLANKSVIRSMSNQLQLAYELHKPVIRKFKRSKIYSSFEDNIWGVDLAHMQLISKYNKRIRYLLCVIDVSSRYARVVPLKDKVLLFLMHFKVF